MVIKLECKQRAPLMEVLYKGVSSSCLVFSSRPEFEFAYTVLYSPVALFVGMRGQRVMCVPSPPPSDLT